MSSIKIYLAKFTIYDGEHEHRAQFLAKANSLEEAEEIAKNQQHEPEFVDDEENKKYWDYGDATTSSELDVVGEVTDEEAAILERLGVAYYFN